MVEGESGEEVYFPTPCYFTPPWCCTPFIPSYIPLLGLLSLAWNRRHRRWRAAGDHTTHYITVLQPQTVINSSLDVH